MGFPRAIASASGLAIAATLYLGVVATIFAYAIWGRLLRHYPAATVTPFALLVPVVGGYSSALVFGERFGPLRLAGMALVLIGIAVIVLPWDRMTIDQRARPRGTALAVRPAGRADAPGVVELIGRVYLEYGFVYVPEVEVPDLYRFDQHYAAPRGAFFVVREGSAVVGSVGVERLDDGSAALHRLYLDARLRGRGTGRALVEAVLEWCRSQNVPRLILWSDTRFDQAHRLYERMGFQRTGERVLPGDRPPPGPRFGERRHGEGLAVPELLDLGDDDRALRALQPVELLLPREVTDHPRDRIDRREAPRRLRGRHGLESPDPLAAREPELGHQRMRHRFSNAFFMAAAPCSIIVRISPASSSGKRSAVQTSRLRLSPSAKTWADAL